MESSIYNYLHGQSLLGCDGKFHMPPLKGLDYVDLLTNLAFILTPNPQQRVSLAGVQSRRLTFKILWATDKELPPEEMHDIQDLFRSIFTEFDTSKVLRKVVSICKPSIYHHAHELVENYRPRPTEQVTNSKRPEQFLKDYVEGMANIQERNEDALISFLLGTNSMFKRLRSSGFSGKMLWPLKQLGRYHQAVFSLCNTARNFKDLGIQVEMEHLRAPEPQIVEVDSDVTHALSPAPSSDLCGHNLEITFEQILAHYPEASPGSVPNRKIGVPYVQHPAVTLCSRFMEQLYQGKIYLGVSDIACCDWCDEWMRLASSLYGLNIYRYSCGAEWPGDWSMPEEAPAALRQAMETYVEDHIKDVRQRLTRPVPKTIFDR